MTGRLSGPTTVALATTLVAFGAAAQQDDRAFAESLWQALEEARLVGEDSIRTRPYEGQEPHGAILEYLERPLEVGDREGLAIVKKNYGGEGASIERVWAGDRDLLASVTVMYRREEGFDPDNRNWYWAKYNPDGSIDAAGRVEGCIACHAEAAGDDYIYSFDR